MGTSPEVTIHGGSQPDTMCPVTRTLGTALSTVGHGSCIAILFFSNMLVGAVEYCARSLVWVISGLSGAAIEQDSRAVHTEESRPSRTSPTAKVHLSINQVPVPRTARGRIRCWTRRP